MRDLSSPTPAHSRRTFLASSGAAVVLASLPLKLSARSPEKSPIARPLDPQQFKQHLAGPILSLPTTFNEDLSVNLDAVRQMVGRAQRYGVPVFALTAGNSKYKCLDFDEIKAVTRALAEAVGGNGLTIAATDSWPAAQVIEYAKHAQSVGADAVQVLRPQDVKDEGKLVAHFTEIAQGTSLPIVLHGEFSRPELERLLKIDSIVAMKEDGELTYYIDRAVAYGDRLEIFSGGAENRYLVGYPYGARAFYSTYTGFAPDKPMQFWTAIRNNDVQQAVAITKKYDYPFISRFTHPFWHATLEYFGVAKRYMRKPFETWPDSRTAEIKAFFDGQDVNPKDYQV